MKDSNSSDTSRDGQDMRDQVREGYSVIAESGTLTSVTAPQGGGCCGQPIGLTVGGDGEAADGCCDGKQTGKGGWTHDQLAERLGYDQAQIAALPQGANMGLSCGNPTAIANLQPGQVVVDLGSGGGFDCFLAGPKVGDTGRVIGVDMTPAMLTKARQNVAGYRDSTGLDNVEFRLGEIEHLPIADNSVDVIISNCVINLSPDKAQVWREIARVLRPGGIVAASDMALFRPLPDAVRDQMEALVGCVAGAVLVEEYQAMVEAAGLQDVVLTPKPEYVEALSSFQDPLYLQIESNLPQGTTAADYITSLDVKATK